MPEDRKEIVDFNEISSERSDPNWVRMQCLSGMKTVSSFWILATICVIHNMKPTYDGYYNISPYAQYIAYLCWLLYTSCSAQHVAYLCWLLSKMCCTQHEDYLLWLLYFLCVLYTICSFAALSTTYYSCYAHYAAFLCWLLYTMRQTRLIAYLFWLSYTRFWCYIQHVAPATPVLWQLHTMRTIHHI